MKYLELIENYIELLNPSTLEDVGLCYDQIKNASITFDHVMADPTYDRSDLVWLVTKEIHKHWFEDAITHGLYVSEIDVNRQRDYRLYLINKIKEGNHKLKELMNGSNSV